MQVDELNKSVSSIGLLVEKIKHNHNVILASVQNHEAKDETNDLMAQIKKISQRVHGGLKRKQGCTSILWGSMFVFSLSLTRLEK